MISIHSLKVYWFNERANANDKHLNTWIDNIETKKVSPFSKEQIRHNLAYGDYLFLCIEKTEVLGFAIGSDFPSSIAVWDQTNTKHSYFTLNIIRSYKKGMGRMLMEKIEEFASDILLRSYIELSSLNKTSLLKWYTSLGYKPQEKIQAIEEDGISFSKYI